MVNQNLNIPVNRDLGNQAQAVFNDMGLDIVTVIDYFLRQIVHNRGIATIPNSTSVTQTLNRSRLVETSETQKEEILFQLCALVDDSFIDINKAKGKPVKYGGWEGKAKIADDFNAPIDDFEEYM